MKINGKNYQIDAPNQMPLLCALRDILNLNGTKYGCGIGLCGSYTVHIDGDSARSCITQLNILSGKNIKPIERLANKEILNPVPDIDVSIVQNKDTPSGAGKIGVPGIAPAILNAIFATTGIRFRKLHVTSKLIQNTISSA